MDGDSPAVPAAASAGHELRHPQCVSARQDGDPIDAVSSRQVMDHQRVPSLMIGGDAPLVSLSTSG
jgi:hypothetical protein